jgi:hypothetical protein
MRATVTAVLDTESGELQTILMGGEISAPAEEAPVARRAS